MGARTVYRHFPDRAELLQALWLRLRERTDTKFPDRLASVALVAICRYAEQELAGKDFPAS